jgi:hypothetical protein
MAGSVGEVTPDAAAGAIAIVEKVLIRPLMIVANGVDAMPMHRQLIDRHCQVAGL